MKEIGKLERISSELNQFIEEKKDVQKKKKKLERKKKSNSGVGVCLICSAFMDDSDQFTCGNPQCDDILRERISELNRLLEEYDLKSVEELERKFAELKETKEELTSVLNCEDFSEDPELEDLIKEINNIKGALDSVLDFFAEVGITDTRLFLRNIGRLTNLISEIKREV